MSRPVRISICAFGEISPGPKDKVDPERLERALAMARRAKGEGAQLAVFPEDFLLVDYPNRFVPAEPIDGPVFSRIGRSAKELDMFIAVNHPAIIDGSLYNTTVLFNPKGKMEGLYQKVYPTLDEMENGCKAGDGAVVLDTEIGRIGFVTCFDLNFEPLRTRYAELDPDYILFNSFYRGGLQTQIWAFETHSYMVCATINPGSRIVNPVGRVLKFTDIFTRQLTHTLELDYEVLHLGPIMKDLDRLRDLHGSNIDIDWVEAEGMMLLSATGKVSVQHILKDLNATNVQAYFKRCCKKMDEIRSSAKMSGSENETAAAACCTA